MPDERDEIAAALRELAADERARADDRRHGARSAGRDAGGDAEVIERGRRGSPRRCAPTPIAKTPHGLLSRGVAGIVGSTLVVNLPGSPGAAATAAAVLAPALAHALELLADGDNGASPDVTEAALRYPRLFASLVKVEHTVFALPFAYIGAFLAVDGVPSAHDLLWITVAMVGARSLAMALNRLIDAGIDARNPRTAGRELPRGALLPWQVVLFCLASLALFLVAVYQLAPIVRWLWPIPVAGFVALPLPEALELVSPLLARRGRRARAARRLGRDHERAAVGGLGCSAAPSRSGSPASTSSTRSSTSTSTARRDCTPCRRASASPLPSRRARSATSRRLSSSSLAGLGLPVGALYWLGVAVVAAPPRLRALARLAARLAPARHGVLHDERRHQRDVLRLRPPDVLV